MGRYKKPRSLNWVSLLVLLVLAGVMYGAVQFGPVYYRKWQARAIIGKLANKIYAKRGLGADQRAEYVAENEAMALKRLRRIGVTDPDMAIEIEIGDRWVMTKTEYVEKIRHPLVGKTTRLTFRPWARVEFKEGDEPYSDDDW